MEERVYHEGPCRTTARASRFLRRTLGALLVLLVSWSPARAGLGSIQNGRLDLVVYFAYDEPDAASWIPVFDAYSRLMLNATEGQLQLGTVRFTKCDDLQDVADVWILNDFSGARAHLSGLGIPGRHIFISQTHKSTGGFARGQFGLAHESGHYLFGCYDEYLGYVGFTRQQSTLHYCTFSTSPISCIMDGGTTISPNNARTEFCTAAGLGFTDTMHNKGVAPEGGNFARTDQEFLLGRSCWSQIQVSGVGALSAPLTPPGLGMPPHTPVTYDLDRLEGDLALALVIDTSGSMSAEGRLEQAVLGARSGVGLLRDQEHLAIIAFADVPSVVLSARPLNAAARTAADVALDALTPGGGTVLGSAVIQAVNQLAVVQGCVEFLVIVTDGKSGAPNLTDPTVLAALAAGGQAVYTVAIGSFPDVSELNSIAMTTGGAFFSVSSAAELPGVLATIFATAGSGTPLVVDFERESPISSPLLETFEVGARDDELRVALSFERGAELELQLVSPTGALFSAAAPPPGTTVHASEVQTSFTVSDPEPGTWTASVGASPRGTSTYDLSVFVAGSELSIATTARTGEVVFPEPMALSVSVVASVPAGGVIVSADVRRPDGSVVPLAFHDDGLAVHADAVADDGIYSALFARYAGDGAYAFDLSIDGRDAQAVSSEECGRFGLGAGEKGQSTYPLEPFFARARHTLLLRGQSGVAAPGSAVLGAHAGLRSTGALTVYAAPATPVAGFRVDVGANEPLVLGPLQFELESHGADAALVDRLALHIDRDADGVLDVPSVPLALGQVVTDAAGVTRVSLTAPGAELVLLEENRAHHFLLTLGEGAPFVSAISSGSTQQGSGQQAAGGSLGAPPPRGSGLPGLWRVGALCMCVLFLAALHRCKPGHRGSWRPATALGGLSLLLASAACGARQNGIPGALEQTDPPVPEEVNTRLTLLPLDVQLTGAVTGTRVIAEGAQQVFHLELR